MKITAIEDLHVVSGLGHFSFLKITTDSGLAGWAEFNESSMKTRPISAMIKALGESLIGAGSAAGPEDRDPALPACDPASGWPRAARQCRDRDGALGHPRQVRGPAGPCPLRRSGARPHPGLLVALRLLPHPGRREARGEAGADARRHCRARRRGEGARLQGPQDQRLPSDRRPAHPPDAGLWPPADPCLAQPRAPHARRRRRDPARLPRRRRARR